MGERIRNWAQSPANGTMHGHHREVGTPHQASLLPSVLGMYLYKGGATYEVSVANVTPSAVRNL